MNSSSTSSINNAAMKTNLSGKWVLITALVGFAGASAIGARGPLIAFNVNLATSDINVAQQIAASLREAEGRGAGGGGLPLP